MNIQNNISNCKSYGQIDKQLRNKITSYDYILFQMKTALVNK